MRFCALAGGGIAANVNPGSDGFRALTVPANFTIAGTAKGARSFELVEKMNGKVVYRGTYTVSDDGKTMTAVFTPEGTNETVTAVYDRQ